MPCSPKLRCPCVAGGAPDTARSLVTGLLATQIVSGWSSIETASGARHRTVGTSATRSRCEVRGEPRPSHGTDSATPRTGSSAGAEHPTSSRRRRRTGCSSGAPTPVTPGSTPAPVPSRDSAYPNDAAPRLSGCGWKPRPGSGWHGATGPVIAPASFLHTGHVVRRPADQQPKCGAEG